MVFSEWKSRYFIIYFFLWRKSRFW